MKTGHYDKSPYYPQSNGHAEAAVKSVKHLILKIGPFSNIDTKVCQKYRTFPPSQDDPLHNICSATPFAPAFPPTRNPSPRNDRRKRRTATVVLPPKLPRYRLTMISMPRLSVGDPTSLCQDKVGVVMGYGTHRNYEVRLPSGCVWWCNHRFLWPVTSCNIDPLPHIPVAPCVDKKSTPIPWFNGLKGGSIGPDYSDYRY